jgi:putative glycosyltransferase
VGLTTHPLFAPGGVQRLWTHKTMTYKNSDLRDWARDASPCELSIVTTLYHSEPFIERFLHDCVMTLAILEVDHYEFVLVDDGSPDQSAAKARALRHVYPGIRIVTLARNFGNHRAMVAGLHHARGKKVFLADCNMEMLPSVLHQFWHQMDTSHADVVFGYHERREAGWVGRLREGIFRGVLPSLGGVAAASDIVTERLMKRQYVEALLSLGDRDVFLAGMMAWTGFTQVGVKLNKTQRPELPAIPLAARAHLLIKAMTSSSVRPLYAGYWLGATTLLGALLTFAVLIARGLFEEAAVGPLPLILATIAGFSGLGLLCLGVLGSYIAQIHVQTKRRPIFIVKEFD